MTETVTEAMIEAGNKFLMDAGLDVEWLDVADLYLAMSRASQPVDTGARERLTAALELAGADWSTTAIVQVADLRAVLLGAEA